MKQRSLGLGQSSKRTRRREFLGEMERVVPWTELVALVVPYSPEGRRGRLPFPVEAMLCIHFMQQWFNLSDPAMEDALQDMPMFREFAGLSAWDDRVPDEPTILLFRRFLEKDKLGEKFLRTVNEPLTSRGLMPRSGMVDATFIAAPRSTKNASGERDPEMKQSKKGNQWYFGMKAHIGVDADSGLVHTVRGTTGCVNDVLEAIALLHGQESDVYADAEYQGADKRPDARPDVSWYIAMRPGKRKALDRSDPVQALSDDIERIKARIRARVEPRSGSSSGSSGMSKCATADWPRTRRSCTRCSRRPTCGWPSGESRGLGHECA